MGRKLQILEKKEIKEVYKAPTAFIHWPVVGRFSNEGQKPSHNPLARDETNRALIYTLVEIYKTS